MTATAAHEDDGDPAFCSVIVVFMVVGSLEIDLCRYQSCSGTGLRRHSSARAAAGRGKVVKAHRTSAQLLSHYAS